ncbi:MAG: thiamine phosphate synthase [Gammaproteobacteria bacterium]|nr:thiamine phosphate synthase [Gammaproteobacteria bacterium]
MQGVLHVITDETVQSSFSHASLAEQASANGADFVQYREKRHFDTQSLCGVAASIQEICSKSKQSRLVVNDRVDVACEIGAKAVHLGKHDLSTNIARRILGRSAFIGGTANSLMEARLLWKTVDYLGVGPIFGTTSKANPAPAMGLDQLSRICREFPRPVIAIGNIQVENVPDVIEAGAFGIAVLSAIVCSDDPGRSTLEFARALEKC